MTVPLTTATEYDEIHEEVAAARDAIDRFYDLTVFEYQAQKDRLASIEQRMLSIEERMVKLENSVASSHAIMDSLVNSRIWRTLARAGSLIQRGSGLSR